MVVDGFINFAHVIHTRMAIFTSSVDLRVDNRRIKAYSFPLGNNRTKDKLDLIEFNYIKRKW